VLAALDADIAARDLPIPRLHGTVEEGPWVALVLDDVDGRHPELPWNSGDLGRVLAALDRLAEALTPAPAGVPTVGTTLGDWPGACRGTAFVDPVFFAPSVAMQGGPGPRELMAGSGAARAADPQDLAATVCAMAGYLTHQSLLPAPPGLPTLRTFQAAQGVMARRWLRELI
jgi:hypothetical protein